MRLQRDTPVAGLDPALARDLARNCHGDWTLTVAVADRCKLPVADTRAALTQLAEAGYLQRRDPSYARNWEGTVDPDDPDGVGYADEWTTTLPGGGLTMASFARPITRKRAEALLEG